MLNWIKSFFVGDSEYDMRFNNAVNTFMESDNPYDNQLATFMVACDNGSLDLNEVIAFAEKEDSDRAKMRDSADRFEKLLKGA